MIVSLCHFKSLDEHNYNLSSFTVQCSSVAKMPNGYLILNNQRSLQVAINPVILHFLEAMQVPFNKGKCGYRFKFKYRKDRKLFDKMGN